MTARQRADRRAGLAFVAPAVLVLAALSLYPGLWVLWLSLQQRIPIFGIARFVGVDHYAFLASDPRMWNAARVTLVFAVASVALELVLGLAAALALQRQRLGRRLAVSLLLLAWALPSVVTAKLFEWLYHPSAGLVNVLLGGRTLNWLGDPGLALAGLIAADVWRTMPFVALLCYARLLTIPGEVYEAARVDGAGRLATLTVHHAAAAAAGAPDRAALPHARRAAGVRPHVRAHRRRAGRHHRDADRVRLPQPVPDAAARLRLGDRRRDLHAGDAGGRRLPGRAATGRARPHERPARASGTWPCCCCSSVWATPFFWQVRTSFTPDAELLATQRVLPASPTTIHYRAVAERSVMPRALGNSLAVASLTTLVALALGLPAAYAIARLPVPGKALLLLVIVASTAFPQIATVSPLYLLMRGARAAGHVDRAGPGQHVLRAAPADLASGRLHPRGPDRAGGGRFSRRRRPPGRARAGSSCRWWRPASPPQRC